MGDTDGEPEAQRGAGHPIRNGSHEASADGLALCEQSIRVKESLGPQLNHVSQLDLGLQLELGPQLDLEPQLDLGPQLYP